MEEDQLNEILDDPKKLLNIIRLLHQLIHLYDQKEMNREMQRQKDGMNSCAGLADTLSVVLTDSKGKIKQEISNERRS